MRFVWLTTLPTMYSASDLTQTELANFRQEVAIMKQLRHPKGKCAHRLAPWCCFILAHLPISLRSGAVHGCFHDRRQPDGECCLLLSWLSCVEVGQHLVCSLLMAPPSSW